MKSFIERLIIMGLTVTLCFFIFAFRLVDIQVVNGKSYLEKQQAGSSRTQTIKAPRGEIVDRNGQPFSRNNASYDIVFDRALAPGDRENGNIKMLIEILRESGEKWNDNLPLVIRGGKAVFTDDEAASALVKGKGSRVGILLSGERKAA